MFCIRSGFVFVQCVWEEVELCFELLDYSSKKFAFRRLMNFKRKLGVDCFTTLIIDIMVNERNVIDKNCLQSNIHLLCK